MTIEAFWNAYSNFAIIAFILLGIIAVLCLVRSIIGPRTADRVVAINMLGTVAMAIIAVLFVKLREGYLADICLIYAMISFLAVIVLSKVYVGAYKEKKKAKEEKENGNN